MTNRQSQLKRGSGNSIRLWLISQLGLTLLIFGGCVAPVTVDRPAPFARVAANAKRIFQGPIAPVEAQTGSSPQPSDATNDQVSTSISSPNVPAIVSPKQVIRSPFGNSNLQATSVNDPTKLEPIQHGTGEFQDDVVQVQYQEPLGRTYSNPSPQSFHHQQQMRQQQMRQQQVRQQQVWQQRSGQMPGGHHSPAASSNFAGQPFLHGPAATNGISDPNFSNQEYWHTGGTSQEPTVDPNEAPAPSFPANQATDSIGDLGTGHFSGGIQLGGTVLRQSNRTATEIALGFMDENHQLQEKLKAANLKSDSLAEEIKNQASTLADKNGELNQAHQLAATMREKIAQLNVKIQDLKQEKIVVQQDADKALKEIETTLDSMLLNSLSKSRQQP